MKLIERYIAREISLPFMVVILILIGLFASFSSARLLAGAVTETLGIAALLKLVFLKTLIALEVLIPIALYISVIIGLGRLNKDQELNVIRSVGVSGTRIVLTVLTVAIPVGIASGMLSSYVRPWAYAESYILDAQAEAELNTNRFQAGRFYGSEKTGRVVYVRSKSDVDQGMQNIFHYIKKPDSSEIVIARQARQIQPTAEELRPHIQLSEGVIYQLTNAASIDEVIQFENMIYFIDNDFVLNYRRKAAATRTLWESDQPRDIAELQWRISRPLATILLALIAVTFIRTTPRHDKTDRTYLIAALIFAAYYNLTGLAKTWVEQGVVGSMPGVWWLYLLMFVVLGIYALISKRRRFPRPS
ncbi:lipopolysaccharide export system permease protein [Nitrosomonas sp. Nm84]|uniref:LPS export ABC transporter permease LptF n=1 Tax=Nitrosomonas sp. Nm84 TaxID=200124 RepID=UPI000D755947|nr:LPS export ABC transporter permease LptF [Nitrosomonas sp. Nm84]PXW90828.1 lipopolysaccharide export system permease protein [Nitrosomonas sp. Nm84]